MLAVLFQIGGDRNHHVIVAALSQSLPFFLPTPTIRYVQPSTRISLSRGSAPEIGYPRYRCPTTATWERLFRSVSFNMRPAAKIEIEDRRPSKASVPE